jgi:hypothetical protein
MADAKAEFTETLKRLLRVPRHEMDTEERKWQEEQREKRESGRISRDD